MVTVVIQAISRCILGKVQNKLSGFFSVQQNVFIFGNRKYQSNNIKIKLKNKQRNKSEEKNISG